MSSASGRADKLFTVLVAEERLYLELQELLQREREYMAERDSEGIEAVVRRKEAIVEEGRLLEDCRTQEAASLAVQLGLATKRPTLSELCLALGPESSELADLHSRLVALMGAVQELLRLNEAFAGETLARVQATLGLLGRLLPEQSTYSPGGAVDPPLQSGRLLRHAV